MRKTPQIRIPPEVRRYVFERDRYHCKSCGKTHLENNLTIDQIIPLARSDQNDISYLQTLCHPHNQQKKHHFNPWFRRHFKL